jgi:RecA-family ATPase
MALDDAFDPFHPGGVRPIDEEPASEWDKHAKPGESRAEARRESLASGWLPYIDGRDWIGKPIPERQWLWEGRIPLGQVTYLTGPGSSGKSLLAQQLVTCIGGGPVQFLGERVRPMRAMYISCEDDETEMVRRQRAICEATGVPFDWLMGIEDFSLVSLAGVIGNELLERDGNGRLTTTERFKMIADSCKTFHGCEPLFVVLDNTSHFFGGDENSRADVTQFLNVLNAICVEQGATILLIGHPNKAGDSYSGSTAWQNAVRSHLVFKRLGEDDEGQDDDMRVLSNAKSNYAKHGDEIRVLWHRWAFVRPDDLPADMMEQRATATRAARENELFMRCLAICTEKRRAVSHIPGSNYAPKVFASMPEAVRLKQAAFAQAMERLIHLGKIALDQELWTAPNRHVKVGIRAVEKCANPPAPTPCADLRQPPC